MDKNKIISKKQLGDIKTAAQVLSSKIGKNITPGNFSKIIARENSKLHNDALQVLEQVITAREKLLKK